MTRVSGHTLAVTEFVGGRPVLQRRRVASQGSVVLVGALGDAERAQARTLHLKLEPLTLQQVVVHAAGALPASTPTRTSA